MYKVDLYWKSESGIRHYLGTMRTDADTEKEAREDALDELWHNGLDAPAEFEVEKLETISSLEDAPEYYTHFSDRYLEAIAEEATDLSFLFDLGNSNEGEIGACIRMVGPTPEIALEKLRDMLWDFKEYTKHNTHYYDAAEYMHIYFAPESVGPEHIVFSETEIT